jgi:hypothetical protein
MPDETATPPSPVAIVGLDGGGLTLVGPDAIETSIDAVVELPLEPGVAEQVAALVAHGRRVGVVVPSLGSSPDDGRRGQVLGLLTAALIAGARVVRTDDEQAARRVVAVVAHLDEAVEPPAKMEP